MSTLQAETSLWVVLAFIFLHRLLFFFSRLHRGPVSEHPTDHGGASIPNPLQSRAAAAGEGTSPSTPVTLRTSVSVPAEL